MIIPARNEEENIGRLSECLAKTNLSQKLFEVIVVNDHSTDDTADIVKQFQNVKLLDLKDDSY